MSNSESKLSREALLEQLNSGWNEFYAYISSLTEEQLSVPTDAAGWTAKDHIIHLAAWEKAGMNLLEGKTKRETLDISPEVWEKDDDPINAVLQERYKNISAAEVLKTFRERHEQTVAKLNTMNDADLQLPYSHYQPASSEERPISLWLLGDTIHHYSDHKPWIAAIVGTE